MNEFIINVKIILNALGYKVLEPMVEEIDTTSNNVLYCKKYELGIDATGFINNEGFVVMKKSKIRKNPTSSFEKQKYNYKLRQTLIEKGIINEEMEFVEDYLFSSPSSAASVIIGNSSNGKIEWVNKDKILLKGIE